MVGSGCWVLPECYVFDSYQGKWNKRYRPFLPEIRCEAVTKSLRGRAPLA
jgi:hypothetical protein